MKHCTMSSLPCIGIFTIIIVLMAAGCQQKRVEKDYHDNGNIASEIHFRGTVKDGPSTYYFQHGRPEVRYHYVDGQLHGEVKRWYFNGNLEYEENYANNQLHGLSRHYSITGKPMEEKTYKEGVLHGPYKVFWEEGAEKIVGAYHQGWYDGRWTYFNEQSLVVGHAEFDKGSGKIISYHKNGHYSRVVSYHDNLKHGPETEYDEAGGLIREYVYDRGELVSETRKQ